MSLRSFVGLVLGMVAAAIVAGCGAAGPTPSPPAPSPTMVPAPIRSATPTVSPLAEASPTASPASTPAPSPVAATPTTAPTAVALSPTVPPAVPTPTPVATVSPGTATPAASPTPQPVVSEIIGFQFQDLTVPVNTTVTWINRDSVPHTSTSGTFRAPSGVWDSGLLDQSGRFSFVFAEPGVYQYYCRLHSSMTASVTVVQPGVGVPLATATPSPGAATATPAPSPTAVAGSPTPTGTPQPVVMEIRDFRFQDLTVPVGTTVTWVNRDPEEHSSTSGTAAAPDGRWDSKAISPGASFSHTFTEAGSFPYFCIYHVNMKATVTVVQP